MRPLTILLLSAVTLLAPLASADTPTQASPAQTPPPAPPSVPGFPSFPLPPFQFPQLPWTPGGAQPGQAQAPQAPPVAPAVPSAAGGLLPPLMGSLSWQGEVRSVVNELIAHLPADKQARVQGVPLVFDPNPNTINAFAGCDERGAPFIAGTEGLLQAIDAISQTMANDDLYGTHTYDQYTSTVLPRLVQSAGASAALPLGIIPFTTILDPRRLSHAREIFDDIAAFTFGHELAHHYLGHTGCANGQAGAVGINPAALGQMVTRVLPGLNQPMEVAADSAATVNVLDTGRARRPNFAWSERGGLIMLDFFTRLDRAAGLSPINPIGFLQTHPHPAFRIPIVQAVAQNWHQGHPG
jgi:hypothetical protein